jgi:hypothetical protein
VLLWLGPLTLGIARLSRRCSRPFAPLHFLADGERRSGEAETVTISVIPHMGPH